MGEKLIRKYRELPKTVKASVWFFLCSFLQRGISVITTPIFTRLLSVEEYGQFSVFNSWLGIVTVFVTLRLYYGVYSQGLVKFESDRRRYVSSIHGLLFALVVIWTVIYLIFAPFFNKIFTMTTAQVLAMLLMIWTTGVFNLWAEEQRVDLTYQKLVVVTVIASILKPVVGIILVCNVQDKVTARIIGIAAVESVVYLPLLIGQTKEYPHFISKHYWKYSLKLNIPLVPHYLSQTILSSADRIMIERLVGQGEAGIYGLAYSISLFTALASNALEQTIMPWIYKKIKSNEVEEINKYAIATLLFMGAIILAFIAFAPEVVALFAPQTYSDAIWIIPPVSMSVYFMYMYALFAAFEFYYEKTQFISVGTILSASLNIILNAIFIPLAGYYAAGYTTLVCYIAYCIGHYIFMRKIQMQEFDGRSIYNLKNIVVISIAFILIGFLLMSFYAIPMARYLIVMLMILIAISFKQKITVIFRLLLNARKNP